MKSTKLVITIDKNKNSSNCNISIFIQVCLSFLNIIVYLYLYSSCIRIHYLNIYIQIPSHGSNRYEGCDVAFLQIGHEANSIFVKTVF